MGAFVIKGGEIYDPAAQKWEKKDIAIENGMIISGMPSGEYQVVDASGCKVTTGWIDYHVHYFNHGTENGINPDASVISLRCYHRSGWRKHRSGKL